MCQFSLPLALSVVILRECPSGLCVLPFIYCFKLLFKWKSKYSAVWRHMQIYAMVYAMVSAVVNRLSLSAVQTRNLCLMIDVCNEAIRKIKSFVCFTK